MRAGCFRFVTFFQSPLKAIFSACRSNVIMINGSVWVARFGAVIWWYSYLIFFPLTCYDLILAGSMGGGREFWCI